GGDGGGKAGGGRGAMVVTAPELTSAEVSIVRLEAPRGPVTTVAQKRRDLVETIGTWAFNRRVSAELAAGNASFLDANASVEDWPGTMRMIAVEASGRPGTWRAMLKDLGTHLQRARLHGFTERELQDARVALVAEAEEAVRREAARPARAGVRQINEEVTRPGSPRSGAPTPPLLKPLLSR